MIEELTERKMTNIEKLLWVKELAISKMKEHGVLDM